MLTMLGEDWEDMPRAIEDVAGSNSHGSSATPPAPLGPGPPDCNEAPGVGAVRGTTSHPGATQGVTGASLPASTGYGGICAGAHIWQPEAPALGGDALANIGLGSPPMASPMPTSPADSFHQHQPSAAQPSFTWESLQLQGPQATPSLTPVSSAQMPHCGAHWSTQLLHEAQQQTPQQTPPLPPAAPHAVLMSAAAAQATSTASRLDAAAGGGGLLPPAHGHLAPPETLPPKMLHTAPTPSGTLQQELNLLIKAGEQCTALISQLSQNAIATHYANCPQEAGSESKRQLTEAGQAVAELTAALDATRADLQQAQQSLGPQQAQSATAARGSPHCSPHCSPQLSHPAVRAGGCAAPPFESAACNPSHTFAAAQHGGLGLCGPSAPRHAWFESQPQAGGAQAGSSHAHGVTAPRADEMAAVRAEWGPRHRGGGRRGAEQESAAEREEAIYRISIERV